MTAGRPLRIADEPKAPERQRRSGAHPGHGSTIEGASKVHPGKRRLAPSPTQPALLVLSGHHLGQLFVLNQDAAVVGRAPTANARLEDRSVSFEHARISWDGNKAYVQDLASRNGTFLNGRRVLCRRRLRAGDYVHLGPNVALKFFRVAELERHALQTLHELTLRDPLTRLYNRRYFEERLQSEYAFSRRHGTSLGVLLLDIDHFKAVNDAHGHPAGDSVLRTVAKVLRKVLRPEDVIARYGGEEFVVLTREHTAEDVTSVGERLRSAVERTVTTVGDREIRVRVSIGAVCLQPSDACSGPSALVEIADKALYAAKNAGRNRTLLLPLLDASRLREN